MANIIEEKSFAFAIRIVNLHKHLNETKKEFVLSKPQAWYIIRRKSVYHQGRVARLYLITRQRVFSCGLMIYNTPC